ncbi:MAG TPA: PBP1A family penicillin-binding protein [Candidatus Binatia bacterium]
MFRVLKWLIALAVTVVVAVGAVVVLTAYDELTATLPPLDRLLDYDPPVATRVYADDGSLIEEFYRERRYRVAIADIPPMVRNAFLAAEDSDFFSHRGVDFVGIARAFLANLQAGNVVQGASTITQQVVKSLLLTPERSYQRKIKEILLSLRLEQHLTKEEILELYLNQIYLGDGNHGIGAAAKNYFGKTVQELTPAEAAMLAGLPAAPSRYSPNRDMEAATRRQHYVLRRMLEEQFLSAGQYQEAMREKVHVLTHRQRPGGVRNYYTEAVRLQLEDMFGAEAPYNQGYSVHTAMQPKLQALAEAAIRNGIERLDTSNGYRGPLAHLSDDENRQHMAAVDSELAGAPPDAERIYEAIVSSVASSRLEVSIGTATHATLDVSSLHWNAQNKTRRFAVGDLVEVRARENGHSNPEHPSVEEPVHWYLTETPQVEAALLAIDNAKGGVAAMVGGYDFLGSQFNRALQARRQPGSAFKPFIYSAALDHGFTPATILMDSPVQYMDHDKIWEPRNYTRDYKGPIRLRTALEQSRNVVSVKIVDSLGVKTVVDYLQRFHLNAEFGPNLSLGLGTTELTLKDLTEGYTTFANGGVKVEPVVIKSIEDKDGNPFFSDTPRRREALSPETAALMTYILEGVVERGTATAVKALDRPVAGKTGTTNDQRDAWFIGFTPTMTVGVWVGYDDQTQTLGRLGTGGHVAAPIWLDFMKPALAGTPVRDFEIPEDIDCVNIDPNSGKRAGEWTSKPFLECFKQGTEPGSGGGLEVAGAGASEALESITSNTTTDSPSDYDEAPTGHSSSGALRSAPAVAAPGMLPPAAPDAAAAPPDAAAPPRDPRWATGQATQPINSRGRSADDSAPAPLYPYTPPSQRGAAAEHLKAEAVETPNGPEVHLYRQPAPAPSAPPPTAPATPPATATQPRLWPAPVGNAQEASPPATDHPSRRIWGGVPIQPHSEGADEGVRGSPNTEPEPRD